MVVPNRECSQQRCAPHKQHTFIGICMHSYAYSYTLHAVVLAHTHMHTHANARHCPYAHLNQSVRKRCVFACEQMLVCSEDFRRGDYVQDALACICFGTSCVSMSVSATSEYYKHQHEGERTHITANIHTQQPLPKNSTQTVTATTAAISPTEHRHREELNLLRVNQFCINAVRRRIARSYASQN